MTYFLDSFSMSLRVDDLIADEGEEKEDRKMNDSLFVQI